MVHRLNPLQKKLAHRKTQKKVSADALRAAAAASSSLQELAGTLDISCHSAAIYLERLLRKGERIDITRFVPVEKYSAIAEAFETLTTGSIPRIIAQLRGTVHEDEVRIVRGLLLGRAAEQCYE
jgi:hypothetical protein